MNNRAQQLHNSFTFTTALVPEVNFPFISSIDVSENANIYIYVKSFKPGTGTTSYKMNRDHKTFDSTQKHFGKQKKRQRLCTSLF